MGVGVCGPGGGPAGAVSSEELVTRREAEGEVSRESVARVGGWLAVWLSPCTP